MDLRNFSRAQVLEARLKWAAVPEDKLRAIAHDLELLAARPTTPKEELVEVLLSESRARVAQWGWTARIS